MTSFTIISDINHHTGTYFQIHATGCRDIVKAKRGGTAWTHEAPSVEECIKGEIADFEKTDQPFDPVDFHVNGCARR